MLGDALAKLERDAVGMVDEEANEIASDDLGEQDLDIWLHLCQAGLDLGLDLAHVTSFSTKKRALRPLPKVAFRPRKACQMSLAELRGLARAISVDPVVVPLGVHGRRERERLARLGGPPELQQRAAEAEERVVVRRRALDDRLELRARLVELARAEVRAPERLANRGLVGL